MRYTLFVVAALAVFAVEVSAETFQLVPGLRRDFDGVTNSDDATVSVYDKRSYCCKVSSANSSGLVNISSIAASSGTLNDLTSQGETSPKLPDGANSRRCFYFTEGPGGDGTALVTLGLFTINAPLDRVAFLCSDTTLYGGFNTTVTDFNFIEVTNTLTEDTNGNNGSLKVTVRATGTAGTEVLSTSFELAAGKRFDVDVHSLAPSDFGPVFVTHNGPPGAIRAVNAQYRIVTQTPFDFEPVLVVPFREGRP